MPKIADPYVVEHLADGCRRFSLTSASGLPRDVILAWKRKGFSKLPDAPARYRYPKTEFEAKKACRALIEFLQAAALPGPTEGLQRNRLFPGCWISGCPNPATPATRPW
jgi:hypothetical protein